MWQTEQHVSGVGLLVTGQRNTEQKTNTKSTSGITFLSAAAAGDSGDSDVQPLVEQGEGAIVVDDEAIFESHTLFQHDVVPDLTRQIGMRTRRQTVMIHHGLYGMQESARNR